MHDLTIIQAKNAAVEAAHAIRIDKAAQALFAEYYHPYKGEWATATDTEKSLYRRLAKAAIAAYNGED